MVENSKIEWTDHTFNPWIGCTKVSPACDNCYAEAMMDHRLGRVKWGADRQRTSAPTWHNPVIWDRQAGAAGRRDFVFCASLADVFDNQVPDEWRYHLFGLIADTPNLVWLLLTKRIGNAEKMIADCWQPNASLPINVAIGATMVTQSEYDRDAPKLAAMKHLGPVFTFGSFEPLLGPVRLDPCTAPDWIIIGGESGKHARPMQYTWARDLAEDALRFRKRLNFKQWGEYDEKGCRVGKVRAGRLLDGRTWDERPLVSCACG